MNACCGRVVSGHELFDHDSKGPLARHKFGKMPASQIHMGCRQNYGPLFGLRNTRCRIILRTQKRTIILSTTHMHTHRALCMEVGGLVWTPFPGAMLTWRSVRK